MPVEAVGAYLRELRERRGISLDEVSRLTRVPTRYLEALEASRLAELPAPVFVRGFIRAYCQALGEPPEHALARLQVGEETTPRARTPQPVARKSGPVTEVRNAEARSRARPAVAVSLVLLVVLGGALVSLTMAVRPDDHRAVHAPGGPAASEVEQASPGPPAAVDVPSLVALEDAPASSVTAAAPPPKVSPAVAPVPVTAPAPAPAPAPLLVAAPSPAPAPAAAPVAASTTSPSSAARSSVEAAYRLVARATEATWIRVRTGDGRTMEETMPAGAVREWASNRPFELTIGNAGGVLLELNGTALPSLGPSGAVISRLVVPADPR